MANSSERLSRLPKATQLMIKRVEFEEVQIPNQPLGSPHPATSLHTLLSYTESCRQFKGQLGTPLGRPTLQEPQIPHLLGFFKL